MDILTLIVEFVSATCVIVATVMAYKTSKEANDIAKRSRDESRQFMEAQEDFERQREHRIVAGCLHAWWGHREEEGRTPWGIVVTNQGPYSAIFRDVKIDVIDRGISKSIYMKVAPPGRYMFTCNGNDSFDFPEAISDTDLMRPISKSSKHAVTSIQFKDQINCRWLWTEQDGLRQVK